MRLFPDNLPYKDSPSWTLWKKETRNGKPAKVPYQVNGNRAKSNDSTTWAKFDTVFMAYQDIGGFDGICWMMPVKPSGLIFIDIDHCIKNGVIEPWAQEIVDDFNSYTEKSQSEHGLHILITGEKPIRKCRKHGSPFEIYDCLRPCYLTGDVVEAHTTIEARLEPLDRLFEAIFADEMRQANEPQKKTTPGESSLSDEALILKATLSKGGNEFKALWDGSTLGYGGDDSAADMALMNKLAFWTGGDALQMERMFSSSGLGRREKWQNRPDYRERTIRKAISDATEFYKPPHEETEEERHHREHAEANIPITRARADAIEARTGVHIYNAEDDPKQNEISEEELNAYSLPEGPKFECNLPADHFIQRFMAYGSDISDAYVEYWFAGGLFALAVAADKKIKVSLKQGTIYPNLYVSINGKSSLARKSTVVDKSEAMLCQVLPGMLSALVPTEFSPEAFTEHLSDHNHAPWVRDEAAGVLSIMKRDYMRGFKDSLMQLFDCKPFYRKLRTSQRKNAKTEFRVDDPYLNLLWATTDASLGANTEQNDTLSGFMARFLFFFPQGKKTKWLPLEEGTAANSIFEGVVRDQLAAIAAKMAELPECTAMHFSPDAARYYTEWQRDRENEWTASNDGNAMQIYSRLAPMVTKLGMLFELGSPDFDITRPIRPEFIQEACQLVDSYFMPTARAVYDLVGANAEKNVIDRIIAYLKKHNGNASRREILKDVKIKSADFNEYLSTMIESEMVESKTVKRGGKGRDSVYVFLRNVSKVAYVAKVANVANVEEIHSDDIEEKKETLATLETKAILPTVVTEGKDIQLATGPHPRKDLPLRAIYAPGGPALEYAPYALNLHGGCSHDCQYCYAKKRFMGTCETRVKKSSLENIESDLTNWQGERKPVHLTFQGDPYDKGRQDNSIVREVLQLFRKYQHPFQVLTKGGTKAVQDFDLYGPNDRLGVTLTFINDVDSLKWEPGAALPGDRIEALRQAHERGLKTWVSLEPVIDPAQTLALIEASHDFVDHYGVGKWNHDARADKINWPKFRADAEALLNKYGKSFTIKEDLKKAAPTPATKSRLWDSITQKMKKIGRKDGKRRGLAVGDLTPEEAEAAKAAGWQQETTNSGITILWATEEGIAAMRLEVST